MYTTFSNKSYFIRRSVDSIVVSPCLVFKDSKYKVPVLLMVLDNDLVINLVLVVLVLVLVHQIQQTTITTTTKTVQIIVLPSQ